MKVSKAPTDIKLLQEIAYIISDIEQELNTLPLEAKKALQNTVYSLGNTYLSREDNSEESGSKYYAFVIKKSFWRNRISLELMSSLDVIKNPKELSTIKYKVDNYKLYKERITLEVFDIESLVKIKRFLLSFCEAD